MAPPSRWAEAVGGHELFIFGLTTQQVFKSRGWYNPHWQYENVPEWRGAVELIFWDYF